MKGLRLKLRLLFCRFRQRKNLYLSKKVRKKLGIATHLEMINYTLTISPIPTESFLASTFERSRRFAARRILVTVMSSY